MSKALIAVVVVGLAGIRGTAGRPHAQQRPVTASAAATAPSATFFREYCVGCHNEQMKGGRGNLALDAVDVTNTAAHVEVLEKVVRKLRKGQMPPEGRPRPDGAALESFVVSLEASLDRAASKDIRPGHIVSRRLNRVEYVNAVQDLLALEVDGAELLPSDMAGFGFDNNADVLSITPSLMSRYITAATKISRVAVASPENRPGTRIYKTEIGARQDDRISEAMPFAAFGGLDVRHSFPLDGDYAFQIRLVRNQNGLIDGMINENLIEVRIDRALVKRFEIGGQYTIVDPGELIAVREDDVEGAKVHKYYTTADDALNVRVPVKAGTHTVSVAFVESQPIPGPRRRGGGLGIIGGGGAAAVEQISIAGPFNAQKTADSPSRKKIFVCTPASAREEEPCAREILTTLARRAYRRPATREDVDQLLTMYKRGRQARDFDAGVERAIEALLSSPNFLIRAEHEPSAKASSYRLSGLELASRLSFFLWRSIPDDELLRAAERGQLSDAKVLAQQVRRMLADDRAVRFMNDFSGQWLEVRNIHAHQPAAQFQFEATLRDAMAQETELFFESQVREDRPMQDLLRADYTFLNARLAQHYGIPDVHGSHMRKVILPDENRFGLLGHGSVLTTTSYPDRTSVVRRGYWLLDQLMGAPPPPPPPNVPDLKPRDPAKPTALRERMELHRNSPTCASCHAQMDPLGFALERFDPVGRWRDTDDGARIDSEIKLYGKTIKTPKEFREALLGQGDEVVRTITEKMLIYALGRGITYEDAPTVRHLIRTLRQNEYRWSSLLLGIVQSAPFQYRERFDPTRVRASATH
jgi:mono/diheme cytochrome c family protein